MKTTTNDNNISSANKNNNYANNSKMCQKTHKTSNLHRPLLKFYTLPLKKQFD